MGSGVHGGVWSSNGLLSIWAGGDGADVTYPIRMCAMSMLMCHLSHGVVCGITGIQRDQSRPGTLAFSFRYV